MQCLYCIEMQWYCENHGASIQPCTCKLKALQEPTAPIKYVDGTPLKLHELGLEKQRAHAEEDRQEEALDEEAVAEEGVGEEGVAEEGQKKGLCEEEEEKTDDPVVDPTDAKPPWRQAEKRNKGKGGKDWKVEKGEKGKGGKGKKSGKGGKSKGAWGTGGNAQGKGGGQNWWKNDNRYGVQKWQKGGGGKNAGGNWHGGGWNRRGAGGYQHGGGGNWYGGGKGSSAVESYSRGGHYVDGGFVGATGTFRPQLDLK